MAQAIVCHNREGMVLAADSLVLQELPGNQMARHTQQQLFALGTHAALLSAGGAVGTELARQLAAWLEARRLEDLDDVVAVGRDFLREGYARHLRSAADPHGVPRHLYFVIGGCAGSCPLPPRGTLLHSEGGDLPFQETALGSVFMLPRRLALEGRLTRQVAEGASLAALAESCLKGLQSMAQRNPEAVGGPYHVAVVKANGVELLDSAG